MQQPGHFGHLCRECLDIPSPQCGYRNCPQRHATATATAWPAPAPFAQADATRAVHVPQQQAVGSHAALTDAALATHYVDAKMIAAAQAAMPPAPARVNQDDSLVTRYVSPTHVSPTPVAPPTEPKR